MPPIAVGDMHIESEFEEACSLLRNECRRRALRILADSQATLTRTELARKLARTGYRPGSVEEIEVSLHHVHLPTLADAGAIRYDAERDEIAIEETGRRLCQFLNGVEWKLTAGVEDASRP